MPKKMFLPLYLVLVLSMSTALAAQEADARIPLARIMLFSSGVGYFEHAGTVDGNANARFQFGTDQINDVLKSMVLRDLDGGTVTAVGYPSQEPLDRALKSFAIDLSGNPSLGSLLGQVRGSDVTVLTPTAVQGKLIGLETVTRPVPGASGNAGVVDELIINLLTVDGLRGIPLLPGVTVRLNDPRLNDELNRALVLILGASDSSRKNVDVSFSGSGTRRVSVSYVAETPVWKTSYRLDLSDGKPFLQGWAIVENTSDSDWNDVTLGLVSGRPISFIQDLYTPLYNKRPVIRTEVEQAPLPQMYAEAMPPAPAMSAPMAAGRLSAPKAMEDYAMESQALNLADSGVSAAASAERAGELFQFTIRTPVTLPRRQSAMLPLINNPIAAEKLSIYTLGQSSQHPLNGARIRNDSGLQLPGGPITVFDGGNYAGDALMSTFIPDDRRLISYAVDLNMLVNARLNESRNITMIRIVNGVLSIERLIAYSRVYSIQNKAREAKTLMVEHPVSASRKLVEPASFDEQTAGYYRFKVPVAAATVTDFTVREQQTIQETISLLNTRSATFLSYASLGETPRAVKEALAKAAELQAAVQKIQTQIADWNREKTSLENGQARIRSNIETLGRGTPEGQRFLQRLLSDEDRIDELARNIAQGGQQQAKAQNELEQYIRNLNVQ
jgi:hypothetical protein